ncbi:MAG: trypsin-like peptidase domain-containing protein [Nitrospira sp.]|nr:trypsin-like peptidase domain-containing protein [Nitrospira sp.]
MKMTAWTDAWREATVAIGQIYRAEVKEPNGKTVKKKLFVVVGTGVIFGLRGEPSGTRWLVTAKHVFLDPAEHWEPDRLYLRFSWCDEQPVDEYFGVPVELRKGRRRRWMSHPDETVDLACLPLTLSRKETGTAGVPGVGFGDFASAEDVYEGAPVVVLGYPGAVGPHFWSRAIMRQGIVSWVSPAKPQSEVFLIDSNVFPGNSGGPVFKLPSGTDRHGRFASGRKVGLLGIVTQARIQKLPLIAGGKELEVQLKGKKRPETLFVPSFVGLGVVEPAIRVKQLLSAAAKPRKPEGRR